MSNTPETSSGRHDSPFRCPPPRPAPRASKPPSARAANGRSARIIGRVSMDSMAIDLSGVPDAGVGDEVLIFGAHDGQVLRPERVADTAGTSPYELLVKVESRRVQRVFVGD